MTHTAKLFITGRIQAVRLPRDYRFEGNEVFIDMMPRRSDHTRSCGLLHAPNAIILYTQYVVT